MMKINLISPDLLKTAGISKYSKIIEKITLYVGGLSFLAAAVFLSLVFYFIFQTNDFDKKNNVLISQIKNLKGSEQRLLFIKDRLSKFQLINSKEPNLKEELAFYKSMSEYLKTNDKLSVSEVSIEDKKIEMSIKSSYLLVFGGFFEFIDSKVSQFSKVEISSFSLSKSGYVLNIEFYYEK